MTADSTRTLNLFHHTELLREFAAGETIFREGDPGDVMYVIREGEVEIRVHDKVIEKVAPGGMVGEMALIDKGPRISGSRSVVEHEAASQL